MDEELISSLSKKNAFAEIAGLKKKKGLVQEICFADSLSDSEFRLLEVPVNIVNTLKKANCLEIRGDADDEAVLCTENETFDMRVAFTSNCLLLTEDLTVPAASNDAVTLEKVKVHSSLGSYYEIRKIRPRFEKLKTLLNESPYNGPGINDELPDRKFSFSDLQKIIQASDTELKQRLSDIGAVLIDGYWRMLDIDYQERAFAQLLKLLEEKDWSYLEVPVNESCNVLEELYPRFVIEHCLKVYGEELNIEKDSGETYFRLSEDKVCQFFAECILRGAGNFNYLEFLEVWKESVPEGMTTRDDHLRGVALKDQNSHPPSISYFPINRLPEDPVTRFKHLFKVRSKWTRDDIEPYICDLVEPGQSINSLFVKYARCSTDANGNKVYNARHR